MEHERTATLIVGDWSSSCSACNRSAIPDEQTHNTVPGYNPDGAAGCGATFTSIAKSLSARTNMRIAAEADPLDDDGSLHQMRPDLPAVPALR